MNLKITGRFIISIVVVTIIVILINISLGVFFAFKNTTNNLDLRDESRLFSPEDFTSSFARYILKDGEDVYIDKDGEISLEKEDAWLQVLDEGGGELYSYRKPVKVKSHYSPVELIQAYKYSLEESMSTIFIGEKTLDNNSYSYIIGFPFEKIKRSVISYDKDRLIEGIKTLAYMVIFIDIPIAILIGYLFSRRLTNPLIDIIDNVKNLSEGEYYLEQEERGIYKKIYKNINLLSSRLRSNEEERKKLDKMKEEWISNISHDIKTPLVSIKGYAEILSNNEYNFTREELNEYTKIIESKSDYIRELIDDLNLSTRLRNKGLILNLKETNLVSLARDVVIDILNNPQTSKLDIKFSARNEIIEKNLDEILIKRVITNLLYNAIVHNDEHISIELKLEEIHREDKGKEARIVIIDNGKGMEEEELEHIFERYYRGTNTGRRHKGSGLGMAIAKDIIKAHNGSINIKSQLGQGTVIEIIL